MNKHERIKLNDIQILLDIKNKIYEDIFFDGKNFFDQFRIHTLNFIFV